MIYFPIFKSYLFVTYSVHSSVSIIIRKSLLGNTKYTKISTRSSSVNTSKCNVTVQLVTIKKKNYITEKNGFLYAIDYSIKHSKCSTVLHVTLLCALTLRLVKISN